MKERDLRFIVYEGQYLVAYIHLPDGKVRERTGIVIKKEDFDNGDIPKPIKNKMARLEYVVKQYIQNCYNGDIELSKDQVRRLIRAELRKKDTTEAKETVLDIYERYHKALKSGEITNKGKAYSASSIKTSNAILEQLKECKAFSGIGINNLTVKDMDVFTRHLMKDGKTQNTISVYVNLLTFFLERTHGYEWHKNEVYNKIEYVPHEDVDYNIYLTEKEIADIYSAEVSKEIAPFRDLFVFGCYVGLRNSDLKNSIDIQGLKDNILTVGTIKKGNIVHIPINTIAKEIWERYKGKFPKTYDKKFVDIIRPIAEKAGIKEPILFSRTEGGSRVKKFVKKFELLSTHTMRRSFASNAVIAGVPIPTIMKLTGHKTYANFLKYIRLSGKEHAELAQKNAFFQ